MASLGDGVTPPASGKHNPTCPFCEGKEPDTKGYTTRPGQDKDEDWLAALLAAPGGKKIEEYTRAPQKGKKPFPLFGGGKEKPDYKLFLFFQVKKWEVRIPASAHHLLPGKEVVAQSPVNQWLIEDEKMLEDVGYNIDCAQNGEWLPTYISNDDLRSLLGSKWADIDKEYRDLLTTDDLTFEIMRITGQQVHIGNHGGTGYYPESANRLEALDALMSKFWSKKCNKAKHKKSGKFFPPYGIVFRMNLQSTYMRRRISSLPHRWRSYVSDYAKRYCDKAKEHKKEEKKILKLFGSG